MRTLLATGAATLAFAVAPALAADTTVRVGDDFFDPVDIQIDPGDTVTWEWVGAQGNHSVTSRPNQPETFDSDPGNDNPRHLPGSAPFRHTFTQVGVTRYYCKLHPSTMNGTVTVGTPAPDTSAPAVDPGKPRVGRRSVRVPFELSEAGLVELTVAPRRRPGRIVRTVRRQLEAGRHSLSFRRRRLPPGRYVVTLNARDAAGNDAQAATASFRLKPRRR